MMAACYPGNGAAYKRHVDNPSKDGRLITCIVYLNKNWKHNFSGHLILKHKKTGQSVKIDPLFNRCVIMQTSDLSLHGYESINFPDGLYRNSIAAYAYYPVNNQELNKSTLFTKKEIK